MKTSFIFILVIYLLILSIFVSCGGGKPSDNGVISLVGTWELLTVKIDGEVVNPNSLVDVPVKMTIELDGTGQVWEEDYGHSAVGPQGFSWHTNGNQFVVQIEGEPDVGSATFGLTENRLTLLFPDGEELIFVKR